MMWVGAYTCMGKKRYAYRVFVGKPEGKRSIGKRRCRWVDNIKVDLKLMGRGLVGWIILTWGMDKCWGLVNVVKDV
jgi:hypothetical protein